MTKILMLLALLLTAQLVVAAPIVPEDSGVAIGEKVGADRFHRHTLRLQVTRGNQKFGDGSSFGASGRSLTTAAIIPDAQFSTNDDLGRFVLAEQPLRSIHERRWLRFRAILI